MLLFRSVLVLRFVLLLRSVWLPGAAVEVCRRRLAADSVNTATTHKYSDGSKANAWEHTVTRCGDDCACSWSGRRGFPVKRELITDHSRQRWSKERGGGGGEYTAAEDDAERREPDTSSTALESRHTQHMTAYMRLFDSNQNTQVIMRPLG